LFPHAQSAHTTTIHLDMRRYYRRDDRAVPAVHPAPATWRAAYLRPRPVTPYKSTMSEREPAVLRDDAGTGVDPPVAAIARPSAPQIGKREAPTVHVVGFWKRAAALRSVTASPCRPAM